MNVALWITKCFDLLQTLMFQLTWTSLFFSREIHWFRLHSFECYPDAQVRSDCMTEDEKGKADTLQLRWTVEQHRLISDCIATSYRRPSQSDYHFMSFYIRGTPLDAEWRLKFWRSLAPVRLAAGHGKWHWSLDGVLFPLWWICRFEAIDTVVARILFCWGWRKMFFSVGSKFI